MTDDAGWVSGLDGLGEHPLEVAGRLAGWLLGVGVHQLAVRAPVNPQLVTEGEAGRVLGPVPAGMSFADLAGSLRMPFAVLGDVMLVYPWGEVDGLQVDACHPGGELQLTLSLPYTPSGPAGDPERALRLHRPLVLTHLGGDEDEVLLQAMRIGLHEHDPAAVAWALCYDDATELWRLRSAIRGPGEEPVGWAAYGELAGRLVVGLLRLRDCAVDPLPATTQWAGGPMLHCPTADAACSLVALSLAPWGGWAEETSLTLDGDDVYGIKVVLVDRTLRERCWVHTPVAEERGDELIEEPQLVWTGPNGPDDEAGETLLRSMGAIIRGAYDGPMWVNF